MGTINLSLPADGSTADVADVNTPFNTIANEINGNLDNANIKTAAAIAGSKLADNSIDLESKASADSGWREVTESWTYASATTITVPTDATTKYSVGDKIRLTQSTVKYFYITAVAATTLTITGGTTYTLVNAAISDVSYSKAASPLDFPQYFNYTPTWTNLTVAGSTVTSVFALIGKTVHYRIAVVLGGGNAPSGVPTFTLPVTAAAHGGASGNPLVGMVRYLDAGAAGYYGHVLYNTTTVVAIAVDVASGTYVADGNVSATVPFAFGNTDEIHISGTYQAA